MKLAAPFTILHRFLNKSNDKGMHLKDKNDNFIKHNYWDQECLEHPTNNSCLIYCD